jgi:L-seryl-tRNA(Ser) seleniumtransferase
MSPSTSTHASSRVVTYQDLGVRPVINCRGTYTIVSGSRLLPQVAEAMIRASDHYVHMDELMDRVGERLAELTGAEWGYITNGCAAALAQVAAACMAGGDPEKIARLPDTTGMPNEVVIQRAHRNTYDRALRQAGGVMVEVETLDELQAALGERTALVVINGDTERGDTIAPQEMIALARERSIPTLVDAAAQRLDLPNRHLAMGADVVTYSGGKCLRGPQASGLALGNKALLKAAFLNGAPHHGLGRPMKAGKEEIMGLLAAVEAWILGRDHEAEWRMWEGYLARIRQAMADLPSVVTRIDPPGVFNVAPMLVISWSPEALGCTPAQAHQALWKGEPRITLHLLPEGLGVLPYMMEAGDDEIAADCLRRTLSRTDWPIRETAATPPVAVAGEWGVAISYVYGASQHDMTLSQQDALLTGSYRTNYARTDISGLVTGARITFSTVLGYQSNETRYEFEGIVERDTMAGQVCLGEFGQASWRAARQDRE